MSVPNPTPNAISEGLGVAVFPDEIQTRLNQSITNQVYDEASELVVLAAAPGPNLSLVAKTSKLSVTGTVQATLSAGTRPGQVKLLVCTVAASTPAGVVNVADLLGGTTLIGWNAVGDSAALQWDASLSKWLVVALNGVTVA